MLGFAMRARRLVLGSELVCTELRRGRERVKLVLVSDSASETTKRRLANKCEFYETKIEFIGIDTDELGRMLGKSSPVAVVAVLDEGFAREIILAVETEGNSVVGTDDQASNRKEASK